ncbi:MAG: tetratricopeptide repeat protein [Acidobacteria bacterium]|nr:tetratricopeptide repeat protein [Acidobacteriota bacterium]
MLRAAAQRQPRDPALYTRIASILAADGHLDQAEQYYRRSLRLDPDQYDALTGLATVLARRGRDAEVGEARRKARAMVVR